MLQHQIGLTPCHLREVLPTNTLQFKINGAQIWLFVSCETKQCGSISNTNSSASILYLLTVSQDTENCCLQQLQFLPFSSFCLAPHCVFSGPQALTFGL